MAVYEQQALSITRIESNEIGLIHLKEMFKQGADLAFDLDDTLKSPRNFSGGPEKRFNPKLPKMLAKLTEHGHRTAILTEQSPFEVQPFVTDMIGDNFMAENLFSGFWICEGGHAVKPKNRNLTLGQVRIEKLSPAKVAKLADIIILTKPEALEQMHELKTIIRSLWQADPQSERWGHVSGVETAIALPPDESPSQGLGTISIHEQGPFITSSDYHPGSYEQVFKWVKLLIDSQGLDRLDLYEAGNGTLRVVQKGMNKAKALLIWTLAGAVNMGKLMYFCDGPNDLEAAELIKKYNGGVVSPNNAIPELLELADYVSPELVSNGVVDFLEKIV